MFISIYIQTTTTVCCVYCGLYRLAQITILYKEEPESAHYIVLNINLNSLNKLQYVYLNIYSYRINMISVLLYRKPYNDGASMNIKNKDKHLSKEYANSSANVTYCYCVFAGFQDAQVEVSILSSCFWTRLGWNTLYSAAYAYFTVYTDSKTVKLRIGVQGGFVHTTLTWNYKVD